MPNPNTTPAANPTGFAALRLTVNNHPGVMSHVCGLFARRAFNVEGILVTPRKDKAVSRIWLLVRRDDRLQQMIRQVRKLYDVLEILTFDAEENALDQLDACMTQWEAEGPHMA